MALVLLCATALAQAPPRSDAYESFELKHRRAADAATLLNQKLRGRARTIVDGRTNRIYVRGGDQAQREAAQLIAGFDQPLVKASYDQPATAGAAAPTAPTANAPARALAIDWAPTQVGPTLMRLFGPRLRRHSESEAGAIYVVAGGTGQSVVVQSEPLQGKLAFSGPEPLTSQAMRLVAAHDGSRKATQGAVRTIALAHANTQQVAQAVNLYREGNPPEPGANPRLAQAQPAPAQVPPAQPDDASIDGTNERLRELGLDLNIEVLPDLDAIILRGSNRDVAEVLRIIEDIERISAETVPEVEVVPLKHVASTALAPLLQSIQRDLLMGRPGRVTIASLGKPNAVLLVGWGEAIKTTRELIAKLDQAVPPQTQLRVFRLRHAAAATAANTIEEFYAQREALGTRLVVTPDVRSNSLIVQAAPRDMAEIEQLVQRIDTEQSASVNLVRIFKLRNSLATNLAQTLSSAVQPQAAGQGAAAANAKSSVLELLTVDPQGQKVIKSGILSDVKITPDPRANSLIVTAPAKSMELVAALIAQMDDSAASVSQIKVFHVVNGDAASLVLMLRALLPQQTGAAPATTLSREDDGALVPLRYSVDTRTNSIIAAGSAGDLEIIEALLLRLDERDVQERKNVVYELKNAPALDVAEAINLFLRSERQVQEAAPGEVSPFQQMEKEVVVVPEPVGNLLIISASPRYYDEIYRMVEEIDAQPPQVLIQVLIAEVTLSDTNEFGIEWGVQDGLLFDRSLLGDLLTTNTSTTFGNPPTTVQDQTIVSATQDPGYNFNGADIGNSGSDRSLATAAQVGKQALANFAVGRTNEELGFGGLVLSAGSKSINVLLRALQQEQRLEVLSRPQVMTIDNQPAFVQVGQKVPLITNVIVNQIGQTNTVDYDNVGLILAVTPRISPEGMVVMEVDAEKSAVAPEIEGIPVSIGADGSVVRAPRIDITTAQTTVSAADGETIVLGGLITESEQRTDRRVPYLASVPVLGWMFRYDQLIARRTELLIILTPHVVRNAADAERLRQIEAARMNWCAADVHALHGDPAFCRRGECPTCNANMPVVYPDIDPAGLSPGIVPESEIIELPPGEEVLPNPEPGVSADKGSKSKWNITRIFTRKSSETEPAAPTGLPTPAASAPAPAAKATRLPAMPTPAATSSAATGPVLPRP